MKDTTFFVLVGGLSVISLTCGFLGLWFAKRQEKKEKHGDPSSFREVCKDNAPSFRELSEELDRDLGNWDYPY